MMGNLGKRNSMRALANEKAYEIHAVGEREVRILKGFRCRLNYLTPQEQGFGLLLDAKRFVGRHRRHSDLQIPQREMLLAAIDVSVAGGA